MTMDAKVVRSHEARPGHNPAPEMSPCN